MHCFIGIIKYLSYLVTLWSSFEVLFWILCRAIPGSPLLWASYRRFFFIVLLFFFIFILFLNFTILYWFCHISTWIRHRYTRVPHPEPSQCTSLKHPVSFIEPGLAIHFIWDITHVSMPFSQIIPPSPSPSPTESTRLFYISVSLLLSRIQGYCCHLSKFHIYVLVYCIGVFLSGLLHSV